MPTHIAAGLGTANSTYNPSVQATEQTVTLHSETIFEPGLPCADNPTRLLLSDKLDGNFLTSCLGAIQNPNLNGVLKFSDGTTSNYHISILTAERVEGHVVARATGTINNGPYAEATINRLGIRLAGNVTACLTGGGVSNSTGAEVVIITGP
ncbi:hypothetical protein MOV08_35245 [Streptomyces yunnanensis]|uniref:BclA C-terminal domain-containing protein n=1 Tax=Streptomyces yunnanensis TaxID=156453 RepID=A0ABY8AGD2_9ACTN|nr:hypothetical protein [Streptomyces yunnanensis]WEB44023.1 hypothetical protein MOV08_35245 [Streptomyces yunnanensis]